MPRARSCAAGSTAAPCCSWRATAVAIRLLPHEVNYRANIFALKQAGATQILGFSAVGSLAEAIAPGHFAVPNQYFDWTKGGAQTAPSSATASPAMCRPPSRSAATWSTGSPRPPSACAATSDITLHRDVTYACVEGPRLGTRAESLFLRQAGCQLVGMTNVPEVFLAREAQICYATIGIATDYDCWMDDPAKHVTVSRIFELYRESLAPCAYAVERSARGRAACRRARDPRHPAALD